MLLIVPEGIEIYNAAPLPSYRDPLLIVPEGIEITTMPF